jgi:hypothetical protein
LLQDEQNRINIQILNERISAQRNNFACARICCFIVVLAIIAFLLTLLFSQAYWGKWTNIFMRIIIQFGYIPHSHNFLSNKIKKTISCAYYSVYLDFHENQSDSIERNRLTCLWDCAERLADFGIARSLAYL